VFVIVEWNQASRQPSIAIDEVYDTEAEAQGFAQQLRDALGEIGRREEYTVHELGEELSTR